MVKNKLIILFLLMATFGYTQNTLNVQGEVMVRGDSIFVFESVRDTVYEVEEKREAPKLAQRKKKIEYKAEKSKSKTGGKALPAWRLGIIRTIQKIKSSETIFNSSRVREEHLSYAPKDKDMKVGFKVHSGIEENSFFEEMSVGDKTTVGVGIWMRKQLFNRSRVSFALGVDSYLYSDNSPPSITGNVNNLQLFHYTDTGYPFQFKYFKSSSYQIQVPFQLGYAPGRFVLSAGGYMSYCNYTIGMHGPFQGDVANAQTQDFNGSVVQLGYAAEIQFYVLTHLSTGVVGSYGGFKNIAFFNESGEVFTSINQFKETKGLVQLVYTF